MTGNDALQAKRDRAACPVFVGCRLTAAEQAVEDAQRLVFDVHEGDSAEACGFLAVLRKKDPQRWFVATLALAAMVNPNVSAKALLAWCDHLRIPTDPDVREKRAA